MGRVGDRAPQRGLPRGSGLLLLASGCIGITVARAHTSDVSPGSRAGISVAGLAVASAIAIGVGAAVMISAAQSPSRFVFYGRPALRASAVVMIAAILNAAQLLTTDPFRDLASTGRFTVNSVVDVGSLAAVVACLIVAVLGVLAAWDASADVRTWMRDRP